MMPSHNRAIIACAGCGKTTDLVRSCGNDDVKRAAVVTYTQKNYEEIIQKFYSIHGRVLPAIETTTWYKFLLSHFVRPYQVYLRQGRVAEVAWINGQSALYTPKQDVAKFYFSPSGRIYSDKIAEFAVACNLASGGKVIARLAQIYSHIFIDEFQDLAGWDFEILELLLKSGITIMMVGDHRQCTYTTNNARKNKQFVGEGVLKLIAKWEKAKLCVSEDRDVNHRGIQSICDLGDLVFPHSTPTKSSVVATTGHNGVFIVNSQDVEFYINQFNPQILRWSSATNIGERNGMNYGESKGLSFPRVLIYPTGPIRKFLATGDVKHIKPARPKLYVAVTRAEASVAFVFDKTCKIPGILTYTPESLAA